MPPPNIGPQGFRPNHHGQEEYLEELPEIEIETGVPVLSKIPILNRVFTNRSTVKDERTLLILIKPTIISYTEEEEKLFPGMRENPSDYAQNPGW